MAVASNPSPHRRFGDILLRAGLIEERTLVAALNAAADSQLDVGHFLIKHGGLKPVEMVKAIATFLGLTRVGLEHAKPDARALERVGHALCRRYWVIPIELEKGHEGEVLHLAMANPVDSEAIQAVALKAACPLRILVASGPEIRATIRRFFPSPPNGQDRDDDNDGHGLEDLFDISEATPVVPSTTDNLAVDIAHATTDAIDVSTLAARVGRPASGNKDLATQETPVLGNILGASTAFDDLQSLLGPPQNAQSRFLMHLVVQLANKGHIDLDQLIKAMKPESQKT